MRWQARGANVIGVHSQQRQERKINLQYSFLYPCNKAETWKQNIKGCSLWTGQINKHQWWWGGGRKVSRSIVYPEAFSVFVKCRVAVASVMFPFTYAVSSASVSRWVPVGTIPMSCVLEEILPSLWGKKEGNEGSAQDVVAAHCITPF